MNRLKQHYQEKVIPYLMEELKISNKMAVPHVEKVVINMGIGDVSKDKTNREKVMEYIGRIAGQKPQVRQTKKSIAEFGIRQGDPVGVRVTLRGERMYEFLDKLFSIVLPRVRDFQGVKIDAFDEQGNYNLGISEQIVFPEVDYDKIDRIRGLQITIKTVSANKESAYLLLKALGMPFEKKEQQ
ncbi:MAG: 50S ribosomal protein L5 [Patescibacteria group bacterium]|jgi:large subunit ribosomal protein L5